MGRFLKLFAFHLHGNPDPEAGASAIEVEMLFCLHRVIAEQERQMAAIDDLNAAIAKLSADVDRLVAMIKPDPNAVPAADVEAAVAVINAIDAKIPPAA